MVAPENRQFVVDSNGKRTAVLLDLTTYEKLTDAFEELQDIHEYDETKDAVRAEVEAGDYITLEEYKAEK